MIPMPDIESSPPLSEAVITWIKGFNTMNPEGIDYYISLNGSLFLLDRTLQDSGSTYKAEIINGKANNGFRTSPTYSVTVTG